MKGTKRRQKEQRVTENWKAMKNGDNKSIFISDYFWYKWTKFSNQKTKSS